MTDGDRRCLSQILVDYDERINRLDKAVFEAAYTPRSGSGLDAQRDRAMSPEFQHPVKQERDRVMALRNTLAGMLGFGPRNPHDMSPRDYVVQEIGVLVRVEQS